jgi:hypothetical protein
LRFIRGQTLIRPEVNPVPVLDAIHTADTRHENRSVWRRIDAANPAESRLRIVKQVRCQTLAVDTGQLGRDRHHHALAILGKPVLPIRAFVGRYDFAIV